MSDEGLNRPFLSRQGIEALARLLANVGTTIELDQLRADFRALRPSECGRFDATLALMQRAGLLDSDLDRLLISAGLMNGGADAAVHAIASHILAWLKATNVIADFIPALQMKRSRDTILIDALAIPWRRNHLRQLLRELGVFTRGEIGDRHWSVSHRYASVFISVAEQLNAALGMQAPLSLARLEAIAQRQKELGAAAEEWMLQFERSRLQDHPLLKSVHQVSLDNAAAGYDIKSFSSERALLHDRFLEVKSYAGSASFFWSKEEVMKAEMLGSRYVLVLIDRNRMIDPEYRPREIADPHRVFFKQPLAGWFIESQGWHLREVEPEPCGKPSPLAT